MGVLQVVLAGLERHRESELLTQLGFWALTNICANGILVTECAKSKKASGGVTQQHP